MALARGDTADNPFDIEKLTKVIFEATAILDIEEKTLATDLAIPLHQDAVAYYRDAGFSGYLPPPSPLDLLSDAWPPVLRFSEGVALLYSPRNR